MFSFLGIFSHQVYVETLIHNNESLNRSMDAQVLSRLGRRISSLFNAIRPCNTLCEEQMMKTYLVLMFRGDVEGWKRIVVENDTIVPGHWHLLNVYIKKEVVMLSLTVTGSKELSTSAHQRASKSVIKTGQR